MADTLPDARTQTATIAMRAAAALADVAGRLDDDSRQDEAANLSRVALALAIRLQRSADRGSL